MEKEGTPTSLGKQVSFDLSQPEEVTQISVTVKNGKPVNVTALGQEQAGSEKIAKLLRQAANLLPEA